MDEPIRLTAIARLVRWLHDPTSDRLELVLEGMNDTELRHLIPSSDLALARVAWSEYGRRRGLADLHLNVVETRDAVRLEISGTAKALHPAPVFFPAASKNSRK